MKILVKPTGPHMYMLNMGGEVVQPNRPTVVTSAEDVSTRLGNGTLKLVAPDLADEATDEAFEKFWVEAGADESLAVEAFVAAFPVGGRVVEEKPVAKKK